MDLPSRSRSASSQNPAAQGYPWPKTQEDLWVELAYYPNKICITNIIRHIWKQSQFNAYASAFDGLLSKRKIGYEATVAYAALQNT